MKKFFKKVEQAIYDMAFESQCGEFVYCKETGKYRLEVSLVTDTKKIVSINGNVKSHLCYKVEKVVIIDENNNDVAGRFPMLVERMKLVAPDYQEVMNDIKDSNMNETERVFGSEAGYLRYKYGC